MEIGERLAAEALALVGEPFRLHGRVAETGLDCVGLVVLAVQRAGLKVCSLPHYHLRGARLPVAEAGLRATGFMPVETRDAGDILIAETGPMQLHLMILTPVGLVHADAGLGRVVLMPEPSPWPVLGTWRCTNEGK